jgi:hypothetical protein
MKLITLLLGLLLSLITNAQYSRYYLDIDQNVNENIKVSGNVNVHKNISTIDYGQLAIANAERERTRLEEIRYSAEKEKNISLEIASDPIKAYEYGYQNTLTKSGKDAQSQGFKKYTLSFRIPHKSLFVLAGAGRYENVSLDGVTTEITMYVPNYNSKNVKIDLEKECKMGNMKIGALNLSSSGDSIFVHKKDLNRATVYGVNGFKSTLIWEDNYQYTITDNFNALDNSKGNGIYYSVKVRTYGDKDEVTFEQLEGRRYYLKRLIEKIVSTAVCVDMRY